MKIEMPDTPKTLAEKILQQKTPKHIRAGEITTCTYDLLMGHDGTATLIMDDYLRYKKICGRSLIFDPSKVLLVGDHFAPPATVDRANILLKQILFAREEELENRVFEGICHQLLVEDSRVTAGKLILGADSHTVTSGALGAMATGIGSTDFLYALIEGHLWLKVPHSIKITLRGKMPEYISGKDIALEILRLLGENGGLAMALEYHDLSEDKISMDSRCTISNMSVETGAMAGIFVPDQVTEEFTLAKNGDYHPLFPDRDAVYEELLEIDLSSLEPLIALPHSPANIKKVKEVEGIDVDQVYLGSCTGGRLEDFELAARIFAGQEKHPQVRMIVIAASKQVESQMFRSGCMEKLHRAGAAIGNSSCGPCCNIDKGLIGKGEVCLATSNRNFKGRMGDLESGVYLASTATAAASALAGKIVDPRKYFG